MPIFISGSYFFVERGQKCFEIASNFSNYLEVGLEGITPYYLEAKIENDEFKISGILLGITGEVLCSLKGNFIEASKGGIKEMTQYGYRIKDSEGNSIFEIRVEGSVCHLEGTIYSDTREIIARGKEGTFVILRGPAIIGKSNGNIGIKLE